MKGHADYFKMGSWNIACSMCGRKFKAEEVTKNWQGMYRCSKCQEPRQPQDFVRGVADNQTVPYSLPETDIDIIFCSVNGISAVPGYSLPGCMTPDVILFYPE